MQPRLDNIATRPACHHGMPARLGAFIALSVVAHALLLLNYHPSEVITMDSRSGSAVIQVSLSNSRQAPATSKTASRSKNNHPVAKRRQTTAVPLNTAKSNTAPAARQTLVRANENAPNPAAALATAADSNSSAATDSEEMEPASGSRPSKDSKDSASQRNFLLGQVHDQLSRHLYYPQRARRRGWQGEVLIAFRVNREGQLGNIRLARSSGYALLDNSAMAAMHKVKAIPLLTPAGVPRWPGPQAMDLQLPVLYQLQEG
jgi:protein TonB